MRFLFCSFKNWKNLYALFEFKYSNKSQTNLIAVVTNSLGCLYFISIQETLVIEQNNFLLMFHFPQYVPIKRRPSAVNIIIANLNGHISQMFWYYTFPKVLCVLKSLDKIACECSHQFIIQVLARTECL